MSLAEALIDWVGSWPLWLRLLLLIIGTPLMAAHFLAWAASFDTTGRDDGEDAIVLEFRRKDDPP